MSLGMESYQSTIPALLIAVKDSSTIVFRSNAPALLPWYNIAYSPETYQNEMITNIQIIIADCNGLSLTHIMTSSTGNALHLHRRG